MFARNDNPVVIAVAPNGARHDKNDHPGLPMTPQELARTAADCAAAGAAMIHLHVRDAAGRHSLQPDFYRPAIRAIRKTVGESMLIQITSESAGVYTTGQQIQLLRELAPEGLSVSVAVREFFADPVWTDAAAKMLAWLNRRQTLVQYIFHSPEDAQTYKALVASGAIPSDPHLVLFVLGRYPDVAAMPDMLDRFLSVWTGDMPWMACAFGPDAVNQLAAAASAGGHVRIGFENGWRLPDGSIASDNASLVQSLAALLAANGHSKGTAADLAPR